MTAHDIEQLGASLAACRKAGTLQALPLIRISSDEEASAVQSAALDAYGAPPAGYGNFLEGRLRPLKM